MKVYKKNIMDNLIIKKDGLLYKTAWNDELVKNETHEVSEYMCSYLFEKCEIDENVSMRDIFLLCKKNITILTPIIRQWIDEWVVYGISLPNVEKKDTNYDNIDYLELSWYIEIDDEGEMFGLREPDFGCRGYVSDKDIIDEYDNKILDKGERMYYGISRIKELIDLPIKLNYVTKIVDESYKPFVNRQITKSFSLVEIIIGIVNEIGFHGSPDMVEVVWDNLNETITQLKNGELETYTLDEVKEHLDEKIEKFKEDNLSEEI